MYSLSKTFLRQRQLSVLVRRQCHSNNNNKEKAKNFFNKILDNPLPLGAGALVVGILQLKRIKERESRKLPEAGGEGAVEAAPWQVTCYSNLPLRHISRLWGWLNDLHLPEWARSRLLSLYVNSFGCNMEEAENSDLQSYTNLGQLFRRRLKPGAREVSAQAALVSPCDGRLLHWGGVEAGGRVEQVKGVSYQLEHFLGPGLPSLEKKVLYQCVLYLAPGDYHCFHSPADWTVTSRRHFPGELMSVSPGVVRRVPSLFCLNERVAYLGQWQHGFFSMIAVGATNVGSVKVSLDPELCTNTRKWERETFHQQVWSEGVPVTKGEYFGEFNLGSTIVLIFEAPEDFQFSFKTEGEIVRVGGALIPEPPPPPEPASVTATVTEPATEPATVTAPLS